ncbi:MAG TPA: 5-formyltetrahydrofolate cyclo-ligase [Verrucomicrobiae bacterium]
MITTLNGQKAALRKKVRSELKNLMPEKRKGDSEKLCAKLKEQSFWKNAAAVLFFAPLPEEIDLWPLLEETLAAGKTVTLPRFDPAEKSYVAGRVQNLRTEIIPGQFGIREPSAGSIEIPLTQLDLILVPGVAFDRHGHRLGRGQGFYDRLLEKFRGIKCGIAFAEQVVEAVPVETRDVKMDFILTPTRCLKTAQ